MINLKPIATLTLGVVLASATMAQANFVQNGDFENTQSQEVGAIHGIQMPNLASTGNGWDVYDALPGGWTKGLAGPGLGIELQSNRTLRHIDSKDAFAGGPGQHYVELDSHPAPGGASMSQTLTGLVVGHSYDLEFYYAGRVINDPNETNRIHFSIAGLFDLVSDPRNGANWTKITRTFEATATSHALSFFAGRDKDTVGGLLDNVSVTKTVPEIDAAAGMGSLAALGAMLAFARTRRRQA